jgi:putative ABC transport system permease protein
VVAGTFLTGRVVPRMASGIAWATQAGAPPVALAAQAIARTPRQYARLAMLLTLTLSIGIFVAAAAGTVGANLRDSYRYQAGSDLRLMEDDVRTHQLSALPAAWHLRLGGVRAASPALRFESDQATLAFGDVSEQATVLGIDPATFRRVAWFRPDFAAESFSGVLALLRDPHEPGVLVNQAFLDDSKARVGDQITVSAGGSDPLPVTVLGAVAYFPTLDPTDGPFAVANLAVLLRITGTHAPSEMWLRTTGDPLAAQHIVAAVQAQSRTVAAYANIAPPLTVAGDPLQVGIYGITSIGFVVAVALCMLGMVAYLYLSVEQRAADFGILRALGVSRGQVATILLLEQLLLVGLSGTAAMVVGLGAAWLFLPYLPLSPTATPPFLVSVPWSDVLRLVGILLAGFAAALVAGAHAIARLQVGRLLRLGDV